MIFLKKLVLVCIIFIFNLPLLSASEKVVFIDIDYVLNNSSLGQSIYKDLEEINKSNIDILTKKEKIIKDKKDEINKTKNIISKDQFEKDVRFFNQEVEKFQKEKNDLLGEFKKNKNAKLQGFLNEINPLIEDYMKKNSIDLILEKNHIFIGNQNKDITNDIIELINNKFSNNG
tara:strand:- start:45 stop:566 length:522 start_codon:yes stop_codon:yes gene_type:complete